MGEPAKKKPDSRPHLVPQEITELAYEFAGRLWDLAEDSAVELPPLAVIVEEAKRVVFQVGQERGYTNEAQSELLDVGTRTPSLKRNNRKIHTEWCPDQQKIRVLDQLQCRQPNWVSAEAITQQVNKRHHSEYTIETTTERLEECASQHDHIERKEIPNDESIVVVYRATRDFAFVQTPIAMKIVHLHAQVDLLRREPDSPSVSLARARVSVPKSKVAEFRKECSKEQIKMLTRIKAKKRYSHKEEEPDASVTIFTLEGEEEGSDHE